MHENWTSVRTHVVHGPVQMRYNHRLTTTDLRVLNEPLFVLFDQQKTAFKVNVYLGFVLKERQSGRLRYYHASSNCCGRYLEEPALITNRADFDSFLERIREPDILQWAIAQRPKSHWVCELVTNTTFFINRIVQHPICCVGVNLPDYVKRNKAIVGLEKDRHRRTTYNDNLCLFRCLALYLKREVDALYVEYTDTPVYEFVGVKLDDLPKVESKFETNVTVYQLVVMNNGETVAELVRRSPAQYPDTMYLNLHETHFSYIQDIGIYCHSYRCRKCEKSLWKSSWDLLRHERTCEAGVNRIYKGGVYHTTPSIFQRRYTVKREPGLQRSGLRAGAVLRHRWRFRQAGGIHDDASKHHQRYRVRVFVAVVQRCAVLFERTSKCVERSRGHSTQRRPE